MDDRNLRGADSLGEVVEHAEDTRRAAALAVCRAATSPADAAELIAMLGLTSVPRRRSTATPCRKCLRPMSNIDCVGHARPGSDGMCGSCYQARRRLLLSTELWVRAVRDIETPLGVLPKGAEVIGTEIPGGTGSRSRAAAAGSTSRPTPCARPRRWPRDGADRARRLRGRARVRLPR